ncbi:adenylate/guanylate cyclase domain-containing protein [Paenibacillus sp. MBLB4367]|uniref:adenylate/guanylate cyclase domain-containing protein n=1 Tax=Paenibacillus sp. MBLB4367 TaxID=3384767 RepID=UPI003907F61A
MKRVAVWLLLLAITAGACGWYAYLHRNMLVEQTAEQKLAVEMPTSRSISLQNMSAALMSGDQSMYVIAGSKKTIYKLDETGIIQFQIAETPDTAGELNNFNELAVDSKGYLYTVNTVLDSYGLRVKSEQIVRFTPNGAFDRVIHRLDYYDQNNKKRLRVGNFKSLQVQGDVLYYYVNADSDVTQYRFGAGDAEKQTTFSFKLPNNKYLEEVQGISPGSLYFSTRSGDIYALAAGGASTAVYPLSGIDRTNRNYPESLKADGNGNLYYLDYYANGISRFNPKNPYVLETLYSAEEQRAIGNEIRFFDMRSIMVNGDGTLTVTAIDRIMQLGSDGKVMRTADSALYSGSYRATRWLTWGAALLSLFAFAVAVLIFYLHVMKRRVSLMLKQIIVFVPIIVISMSVLSYFIYTNFSKKLEEESLRELAMLAHNGRNLIDGDKLEKMTSPLDYMNDDYKQFRRSMDFVFEGKSDFTSDDFYKALYRVENGVIYRLIEDDDSAYMYQPFESTPANSQVIKEGKVVTDQWVDDTGSWMYALSPLYNAKGEVVGLYEISKNLEGIVQHRKQLLRGIVQNLTIITGVLILLFMVMTYFQLASIRKLRRSVTEIASGNWDATVSIRTRDEVQDLGEKFNMMAQHIRDYIAQITRFSEAYYRFVPQQFLQYLDKRSILDVRLGDQVEQDMSILVTNIRSFYRMSKRLTPEENFNFINSYLKRFGPYVHHNGGLVNKYLGAGIMALFPNASGSDDALRSAIEMRRELEIYNMHRANSGYLPVDIGIAIHKGPLRLGIIGEEKRMENNVISDDVNMANELEKLTDALGVAVLATEHVMNTLIERDRFHYRCLGLIRVDGKDSPLVLYDVFEGEPETIRALKERTKTLFERGIELYQVGRFYDAREAFVQVIKINRQDQAAKLYFYMCDEYYQNGTTSDWNGTLSVS